MSLKPGIVGQPAELTDGAKANGLIELTSGNGVQLQGRTNGVAIEAGKVGEKVFGATNSVTIGASEETVNVTNGVPLTAGVWLLTFSVSGFLSQNPSSNCELVADIIIRNSSNVVQTNIASIAYVYNNAGTITAPSQRNFSATISTVVSLTSSTTIYGAIAKRTQSGSDVLGQWRSNATADAGLVAVRIA